MSLVPEWGCDIEGCTDLWTHQVRYRAETANGFTIGIARFRCPEHKDVSPERDDHFLWFEYESTKPRPVDDDPSQT